MKKTKSLLYDPLIINRVKQYLEENVDQTYLDVGVMTKQLQERYPEYARRKIAPFRALVDQAYRIVSQSYGMDSQPTSGEDSDGSDLEVMDDSASNNLMSNMINSLYNKPKSQASAPGASKPSSEAIDISSDESGDESRTNGKSKESALPGMKTFRDVTLTKVPTDSSKSSNTTDTAALSNSNINSNNNNLPLVGQKRSDTTSLIAAGTAGQPVKKRKLDEKGKNTPSYAKTTYQHSILDKGDQHSHPTQSGHQQQSNQHQLTTSQRAQLQQQHQQYQRISNYNQNSNDSGQSILAQHLRHRKYKKEITLRKSRETFQDIGGMEKTLKELCELLMHIKSPDIYFVLGLMPPRGLLLHGPPGCGKTLLAHAIAGQLNLPLIEIPATELIAGVSGESEERIRDVFEQSTACAPCVLFIDEIDAISSNRSMAQKDMERRVVSQLISSLDNLKVSEGGQAVLVIGATTRPDVLDPALRRVGRFDHEIAIGIPNRKDRKDILTIICDGLSVEPKCDFDKIAELTPGYVGADLLALVSRAANIAVKRKCSEQIREFQAEAQRNITIVDLDDDAEDTVKDEISASPNKTDKDNKTDVTETEKEENNGKEKTVESEERVEKSADMAEAESKEKTPDAAEECDIMEVDGENKTKESKSDEKSNEKSNEKFNDKLNEKSIEKSNEKSNKKTNDKLNEKPNDKSKEKSNEKLKEKCKENSDEKMDEIDAVTDSACKTLDQSSGSKGGKDDKLPVVFTEPSLFELLNWLDNPPEDITFVSEFSITLDDFCEAVKLVQPSAKREGFITVPDVTWDDIGSLQDIREELKLAVLAPVKFPEKLERLGLTAPSGVLLCGPPGCGKTLLAKAIANEAGINFISVKGPELMNMYVGESERAVRACFQRARNSAPCVIFFDEFDSLCPKRSETNEGGSGTRVVNQLLTEMDGVEDRQGVYILAATNRPDIIDPAILRPGRLDTILYVGLPKQEDREDILKATTKNRKRPVLDDDVNFTELSELTDGYTGADLAGLVRQASMLALKESLSDDTIQLENMCVRRTHFKNAIKLLRPSVSVQDRKVYEKLRLKFAAPRVTLEEIVE